MDPFWSLLMLFGSALCHQIPERSYLLGDLQMPICARCIGIHIGFLLSSIIVWTGARRFSSAMPGKRALVVLIAIAFVGFIEAVISYGGISESDNLRRTISGILIGTPLPFIIVPFLNLIVFPGRNSRVPFKNAMDWVMLIIALVGGAALILLATSSIVLFVIVSVLGIIGIVVLLFTLILLLVAVLTDNKAWSVRKRMVVAAISCSVVIVVLAAVHNLFFPFI